MAGAAALANSPVAIRHFHEASARLGQAVAHDHFQGFGHLEQVSRERIAHGLLSSARRLDCEVPARQSG
jgi:hypothetical protein